MAGTGGIPRGEGHLVRILAGILANSWGGEGAQESKAKEFAMMSNDPRLFNMTDITPYV